MGRTLNSDLNIVPINGAIYRNSSQAGVIQYADGTQYIPSNGTAIMSATDYPAYVAAATASLTSRPTQSSTSGQVSNGVLATTPATITFSPGSSLIPSAQYNARIYYPFAGKTSKLHYMGSTATSGSTAVVTYCQAGYRQSSSNDIPAYTFNTSGTLLSCPTTRAIHCWYDSITSTFRIIGTGGSSSSSPALLTSSDGVTWTSTNITVNSVNSNSLDWTVYGTASYYDVAQVSVGQKVFMTTIASTFTTAYALWVSTDNGVTFYDRTFELTGSTNFSFSGTGYQKINLNYNGTTLFVPVSSNWKYSTNDGSTWTAPTISGVTTSVDNNPLGACRGADSSTFMYIYSANVTSNRVYVTTNGGQSFTTYNWTPAAAISGSYPEIASAHDGTSRWCFAYVTTNGIYAATSTNNGSTWTHTFVTSGNYSGTMFLVYLDDAFYLFNGAFGIFRSTNATTWTRLAKTISMPNYGQIYYSLTDAVVIGNWVIKKSDQSTYNLNPDSLISNVSGNVVNFGNYITSDLFVRAQLSTSTNAYQLISSSNVFSSSLFSPQAYSSQQTSNNPQNIEYWRIK